MSELKIEQGKRYVTREGQVTGQMIKTGNLDLNLMGYPFIDPLTNRTYAEDGAYLMGLTNDEDIVREAVEPEDINRPKTGTEAIDTAFGDAPAGGAPKPDMSASERAELRDRFAMAALPSLLATAMEHNRNGSRWPITLTEVADRAYLMADLMLEERAK